MIGRSYGDRMQCWPSGINCQNFVLDKGTISDILHRKSFFVITTSQDIPSFYDMIFFQPFLIAFQADFLFT